MELYIGGAFQGKAAYATARTGLTPVYCTPEEALREPSIDCYHRIIRAVLASGGDPAAFTEALIAQNPDAVIVCDEVGLGVVPLDPFERRWREAVGRSLCRLAEHAERVERISCGLGLRIK